MQINANEKALLRELAKEYMEVASLPVQREKMELWKTFNSGKSSRPMVLIDQIPWHELNYDGSLTLHAENGLLRNMEYQMRRRLFAWKHFPADMVVEPFLIVPFSAQNSGYGVVAEDETLSTDANNDVVSHNFINQFEEEEDAEKIKDMVITLDPEKSKDILETAQDVFDGIVPIHQKGGAYIRLAFWDILAELMGVENIYMELYDRPEFLHDLMNRLTNSALAGIRQVNELGLVNDFANTEHCSVIYTDELLPDFAAGKGANTQNGWANAMAQLFSSVAPSVTQELEIDYMKKISSQFGMFYYGCCERLDDRLEIVEQLPNLKKVSCSPWSDRAAFMEKLRRDLIVSNKPNPSFIAGSTIDWDVVKQDLALTRDLAYHQNRNVEMILKDISTIQYQPQRLTQWAETAMSIATSL